ncbi:MAG: hypothetical protein FJW37_13690, partial [Acidobacteria bacterium]|nr:hypothetical protein [Acidobacteriota bacterium]
MKRLLHPVVLIALLNLVILQTVATLHLQEAARPLAAESPRFDGPSVDDYVEGVVHELNGEVPGVSLTPAQAARLWAGLDSVRAGLLRLPGGESRALGL